MANDCNMKFSADNKECWVDKCRFKACRIITIVSDFSMEKYFTELFHDLTFQDLSFLWTKKQIFMDFLFSCYRHWGASESCGERQHDFHLYMSNTARPKLCSNLQRVSVGSHSADCSSILVGCATGKFLFLKHVTSFWHLFWSHQHLKISSNVNLIYWNSRFWHFSIKMF